MSIVQRVVLLLKVLVLMTLSISTAWAQAPSQSGTTLTDSVHGLQLASSDAQPGDQNQGGSKNDDDSTTDGPDSDDGDGGGDEGDDGDSQT